MESAVVDASGNTTFTGNDLFTRQGDFTLNKDGYLVNGFPAIICWVTASTAPPAPSIVQPTNPIQLSALLD